LNKKPELKHFVKYGGADCFENVQVEFQPGKKAILTIYHDGVETEQVELQSLPTYQDMHDMMLSKGFQLKATEKVARIRQEGDEAFEKDMEGRKKRQERAQQKMEYLKTANPQEASTPKDDVVDTLPNEEQITKEQMRQWKLQKWKTMKEEQRLANAAATAAAGNEL
jgi:hypothetical protein